MIGVLIGIILIGALYWAALPLIPLGSPFNVIVRVLMVLVLVVVVLYIIQALLGAAEISIPLPNLR